MTKRGGSDDDDLRRRAERRANPGDAQPPEDDASTARLLHELQVHQIELEMQNEELQAARNSLETLLEQYTDLYDFAPVGYATLDRGGVVRRVNLTGARLFGADRSAAVGRRLGDFVRPEDRVSLANAIDQLFKGGVRTSCEVTMMPPDRDGATVEVDATLTADGTECLAILQDITIRRHADEAVRLQSAALNAAANPIIITDRAGTIRWVNTAFTTLTGYSFGEAIGRNPRDLVKSGTHGESFYRMMWSTILAGNVWSGEMINRRKDGSLYPEALAITPVSNRLGEITHFVAIKRDLTEEKMLQAQLLQSQKLEGVGLLAGGIAHDFNNVLTVINTTVALVLDQLPPEGPLHSELTEVQSAAQRATLLTRQLLAFSRKQLLQPTVLDLNDILRNMVGLLRRLLGEDVELVTRLAADLPAISADAGQIEQVLVNLAVNARDAMPDGGVLMFETSVVEPSAAVGEAPPQSGRYAALIVRDTGVGMDHATQARIFEPFFTTKEMGRGTGLGLSTVYGIVAQSGGEIRVESSPGFGSAFTIVFPGVADAPRARSDPPGLSVGGGEHILVVDDERALSTVARRILSGAGYDVRTANSAAEALAMLERDDGPIDLLITDVVMPGMNGSQLAERVHAQRPGVRILYASGYTDSKLVQSGVDAALVHFIAKPYTIAELLSSVRSVLDAPAPLA